MPPQTQPTATHSPSPLERCAPEILQRIVLFAVEERFLGPPSDLLALLTTSKAINFALSPRNNNDIYARIFKLKFDTAAASRRLGPRRLTSRSLAIELRDRFEALRRVRGGIINGPMLQRDLWVIFFILLEHDRKNVLQLTEWARAHTFAHSVADHWLNDNYAPGFDESVGGLVCTIIWELVREGQLYGACTALDDCFDAKSTLAELTESRRRTLQTLLYTRVLLGYRVGSSFIASIVSLTGAVASFILCLRGVLQNRRTIRRIGRARTG